MAPFKDKGSKKASISVKESRNTHNQGSLMFLEFMAWSLFFSQLRYAEKGEKRQPLYSCEKLFTKQKLLQGLWQSSRAWSAAQGNIIRFTVLDFTTRPCYPDLEETTSLVGDWTVSYTGEEKTLTKPSKKEKNEVFIYHTTQTAFIQLTYGNGTIYLQ